MKKIKFTKVLSVIFSFIICFSCVFGLSSCIRSQELKLARIQPQGDYIFRSELFFNQGNTVVNIRDKARKKIMREKFVIADKESRCEMPYFEKDGIIYFIICYLEDNKEWNNDTNHYESDMHYAFGCTPIFNVDVTISEYFMLREKNITCVGLFGNYAIFVIRETKELLVYDIQTLERVEFDMDGYAYEEYFGETFMLEKVENGLTYYRIYDKNLSYFEISNNTKQYSDLLYKDYVFFYDYKNLETTISAVNYKTGESLTNEESLNLYSEYKSEEVGYHFSYNGRNYSYDIEEVHEEIPTGTFDENGQEVYKYNFYLNIVFTDVETKEEYTTTNLKLLERATEMQEIQKLYGVEVFSNVSVASQDGDLFFIFWNEDPFFGLTTPKQSPNIMFKYNAETQGFDYIGFAYRYPTHIYKGVLEK